LRSIVGGAQSAAGDSRGDNFAYVGFNNRGLAIVDQVNLGLDRIDTNDFMSTAGKASRRYGADIT
jgi:hypothetical protein